jgi:hypothetical protein
LKEGIIPKRDMGKGEFQSFLEVAEREMVGYASRGRGRGGGEGLRSSSGVVEGEGWMMISGKEL